MGTGIIMTSLASDQTVAADHPAVGRPVHEMDTPALLLDIDACDRNLKKMATYFADRKAKLRPHFKNHKCVTLARRQLASGSCVGLTCAKLGEAQVCADAGFDDILIANQIVGAGKMKRLVALAKRTKIAVAVDHPLQAQAISDAATAGGVEIGVLIEVDSGMKRCGVEPGQPALDLARLLTSLPGIRFEGIQCYEGHTVYINDLDERTKLTREALERAVTSRRLIEDHGIAGGVISGGSTGTYHIAADQVGIDEVQAGTYATMDWRYQQVAPEFEIAQSVLVSVISTRPGEAVIDIGVKGAGNEFGLPRIKGADAIDIPFFLAEEHCAIRNTPAWQVGDTLELVSSHACTTCNLHREFFVHRDGVVIDVWPIEASGRLS
jgi:D-serine deaminase-like pyridoxal phosphate-dependent protein